MLCRHNESGDDDDGSLCVCAASYRSAVSIMRLVLVLYWQHALLARLPGDCSRQVDINVNTTTTVLQVCGRWSRGVGGRLLVFLQLHFFSSPCRPRATGLLVRAVAHSNRSLSPPRTTLSSEIHPTLNNCNRRPRLQ